jgi:serine phosphatase RsbU (regulator of sigma subunit)
MCAPLLDYEGAPLGVLQVDTVGRGKPFDREDLEVLVGISVQAGMAIDNAQMHEAALRQKELEQDLALAREIQSSFLPQSRPAIEGYKFFDYYCPAHHVGGDYLDYITLPDGRLAVVVGDVVGHGVAAAMMMAKLSGETTSHLEHETDPAAAITKLNALLIKRQADRFVTLLVCVLDPRTHEVTIANAGHMPPIWRHADGSLEEPGGELSGLPLGVVAEVKYRQQTVLLARGDYLLMYTDGINEARNAAGRQFTVERIRQHVRRAPGVEDAFEGVLDDVRQFIGRGPQADDMCLVCLQRT